MRKQMRTLQTWTLMPVVPSDAPQIVRRMPPSIGPAAGETAVSDGAACEKSSRARRR